VKQFLKTVIKLWLLPQMCCADEVIEMKRRAFIALLAGAAVV